MMKYKGAIAFSVLLLVVIAVLSQPVSGQLKEPSAGELVKIKAAVPAKARVAPAKGRKLLVFSRSWGYKHTAITYGRAAVKAMAEKNHAFEAVCTNDLDLFEPDKIMQFDAILFNNTNNEIFLPENFDKLSADEKAKAVKKDKRLKRSLVRFIKSGRGLAFTHAGVASFRNWPEFGNIIGARFDNHPWGAGSKVTLKIDEPEHPVMQAFEESTFTVSDEIYQLTGDYSREKLRVLLSIDTDKSNMNVQGLHRKDNDYAMSYIKSYGKGRVFYCALGHQHELFWNPIVMEHYLDGIQFVLGDLRGDMTPSAKLSKQKQI